MAKKQTKQSRKTAKRKAGQKRDPDRGFDRALARFRMRSPLHALAESSALMLSQRDMVRDIRRFGDFN